MLMAWLFFLRGFGGPGRFKQLQVRGQLGPRDGAGGHGAAQAGFVDLGRRRDRAGALARRQPGMAGQVAQRGFLQGALLGRQQGLAALAMQVGAEAPHLLGDRAAQARRRGQARTESNRLSPQQCRQREQTGDDGDPALLPQPGQEGLALLIEVDPGGGARLGLQGGGEQLAVVAAQGRLVEEQRAAGVQHGHAALADRHTQRLCDVLAGQGPAAVVAALGAQLLVHHQGIAGGQGLQAVPERRR
jgi:hypothetical protein